MSISCYIKTDEELRELCSHLANESYLALDTEFVWTKTYFPNLGIIQIASEKEAFIIDYVSVDDLTPLKDILENPEIVKIFHDAYQDVSIVNMCTGARSVNIFDTQVGAAMTGLGGSLSLEKLLKQMAGISLPKTETRTDWVRRPLNPAQIEYALDDVKYLVATTKKMLECAEKNGTKEWLFEEMRKYDTIDPFPLQDTIDRQFLKNAGRVNDKFRPRLYSLVTFVEELAREANVPRDYIIRKDKITFIATRKFKTVDEFVQKSVLQRKAANRFGEELLRVLKDADGYPEELMSRVRKPSVDDVETSTLISIYSGLVFGLAKATGIDPLVVTSKNECADKVRAYMRGEGMPTFDGWRGALLNKGTIDFLNGDLALKYDRSTRTVVPFTEVKE